jgi:hypothetical protein
MLDDTYGRDTNQYPPQFVQGTPVYDVDGDKVGTVADVDPQNNGLIIQKGLFFPKDFTVPMSVVARADADGIYLNVSKDEVTSGILTTPDTFSEYDEDDVDPQTPYRANAGQSVGDTNLGADNTPYFPTANQDDSDQPLTNP